MRVLIENLTKAFGKTPIIRDISLEIHDHELFFLLGPSGCGKTTLLRIVAGFYEADAGRIWFGDRLMNSVPPHRRNTGMVFQNYALWPHMTVADNVAYGLEVRAVSAVEKKQRVTEALAIVQMADYAGRLPNQLSGGQQQRIALARALVVQPDVLLLDEPLSNLDAKLRLEMREEIRRIHGQTRITTIYVTHDQKESLSLADRMAVLRHGAIEQIGDPRTIYRAPANRFVADFIGETNWLPGEVQDRQADRLFLHTACGLFEAKANGPMSPGTKVWIGFRPEAVMLHSGPTNTFEAQIAHISYLGEVEEYQLQLAAGFSFKAIEQNPQTLRRRGNAQTGHILPANLFVFPAESTPASDPARPDGLES
jgi:iron(III) transport system ATP-binding protein